MYNNFKDDPHTDYKDNWIEKRILYATDHMHEGYAIEDIIKLLAVNTPEQSISLILAAAEMMFKDEIEGD